MRLFLILALLLIAKAAAHADEPTHDPDTHFRVSQVAALLNAMYAKGTAQCWSEVNAGLIKQYQDMLPKPATPPKESK